MRKKVYHVVNRTISNWDVIVWQSITTARSIVGMPAVGADLDYVVVNAPTITDSHNGWRVVILWL
ncbi:hypothetical protein M405DRAFT_835470 [Rhizopogon salebrosus TDB-379]|nr:hypothetical protein M405DRAFT_835558 [Rhizopogon salebrosus TDB-379]KAJ8579709.1 hypothetical protein M405DRAFT_835470 [Rhizopogon salebrosus TDB-379]